MNPYEQYWANYRPANARGVGAIPGYVLAPHALTPATGGQDINTTGTEPIIPSAAGTTAFNAVGVVANSATPGTSATGDFSKIVTALVSRNLIEMLRDKAIVLQESAFLRATHVPGTNIFRYVAFVDLPPAVDLLEGIPPVTVPLSWDSFEFAGGQKGNIVAITDLAELFSPFDLYRVAAEKVAWNALDTAEKQAVGLMTGAEVGVVIATASLKPAENVITAVVGLKKADIPMFSDGTYHGLISPADAALLMTQTGELGWTDTMKYAKDTALLNGEVGQFRGVRFVESNRIPDHKSVIFGPGAVVWGDYQTIQTYRVAPGGDHADPLAQRGLVGWKGMWGMSRVAFDGSPAVGPTTNTKGFRFAQVDITKP